MRLEVLPAGKGDCLLIHCGAGGKGLIIVDGGPAGVYRESLRRRLMALRAERGLSPDEPLVINLILVSHVDDDHIIGIIDLFEEMADRVRGHETPLFQVERLWHNSFDHIVGNDETAAFLAGSQFGAASTRADLDAIVEDGDEDMRDSLMILAGLPSGDKLRGLASDLGVPINPEFDEKLIQTRDGAVTAHQVEDVTFTILGPRRPELQKLQRDFDKWFKDRPRTAENGAAFLAAYGKETVSNLSSIVALAEDEDWRKVLLTGDARGDKILLGAEESGLLGAGDSLKIDIMKLPHHGSAGNIQPDLLRAFPADHYVFSGNGEHGNPERRAAQMILDTAGPARLHFYFPYPLDEIDPERARDWEKERAKRKKRGKPEGPPWSEPDQALRPVLSPPPAHVRVVEPDGNPMLI